MYHYLAYTREKKIVEGTIDSTTEKMAEESLYKAGFESIVSLRKVKPQFTLGSILKRFSRVSEEELVDFTNEMAELIEAGLTLLTSLKLIQSQTSNKMLKDIISEMVYDIQNGKQLHEALSSHRNIFPATYRGIIQASEKSGTLEGGLKQIAADMKRKMETKSRVKRALMQPAIITVLAMGVIFILTNVVLPPLADIFRSFDANMPITASIMIWVADFTKQYTLIIVAILVILIIFALIGSRTPGVKNKIDRYILKIPIIGTALLWYSTANACRTMGTLVKAGIILPETINTVILTISNSHIQDTLRRVRSDIIQGKVMSESVRNVDVFPKLVAEMVSIGEKTGQIEDSLVTLADYYDNKLERRIIKLTTLLEPMLIVGLGLIVGFLAISVIGTLYSLPGAVGF